MFVAIGSFLLLLVSIYMLMVSQQKNETAEKVKPLKPFIQVLIVISLFGVLQPCVIVPAGSQGVVLTFGKVSGIKQPGLAFKLPIAQNIELVTTKPIQLQIDVNVGPTGAITKDNQTVGAKMTFFYKYNSSKVKEIWQDYGIDRLNNIVSSSGIEAFKTEIGKHAIFDVPVNQAQISSAVIQQVKSKLTSYPVEITELRVTNYDWSDEFDKQIQETMHRAQQVKQKEQELLITEQEAQKKVKEAEADKQSMITTAEGEKESARLMAEAKALEGEGIRKYNQSIQANMSLEIELRKLAIEMTKAEKWDGAYVANNNYGPIPISSGILQGK